MLNIDSVIRDKYPDLHDSRPRVARGLTSFLRRLFHETEFHQFADTYPHLTGIDFVEQVLDYFQFSYDIKHREIERIPAVGKVVIIANHPIGSLDGLSLLNLVSKVRPDVRVVANDVLMALKPLQPLLLPVDNMTGRRNGSRVHAIEDWLQNEGALIIFPSGEVSRIRPTGVRDTRWRSGFLRIARAAQAPILPTFIGGRNSALFYGISMLSKPVATLLLVHEMFKQATKTVPIRVGNLIPHSAFDSDQLSRPTQVRLFRKHLYRIGAGKPGLFKTETAIAHPEPRRYLKAAIAECEQLGRTPDGKDIVLYRHRHSNPIMREIGRLREMAFRAVGEGSGQRLDMDRYDSHYDHIVLWSPDDLEVVGAYRVKRTADITANRWQTDLYSLSLFKVNTTQMAEVFADGLELGRSFVQPRFWGKRSLDYLWQGIGAYLRRYPARFLFGPVTISGALPRRAQDALVYFYRSHFSHPKYTVEPNVPYPLDANCMVELNAIISHAELKTDFANLKAHLAHMGCAIPTLYKQYSELCQPGGVHFLSFSVDLDFANCVDGLVLVDAQKLKPKKRKRYLESAE